MSVNMTDFVMPKSDQLNADDLIGGPRTITVTSVTANAGSVEQPVSIWFVGDEGKPYKACKSMRRVLIHVWGADAKNYVGRSMTLYCDPSVQFGGMKVGGIRISHMSHMEKAQTMALTATKAKRAPFTVQPLVVPVSKAPELIAQYVKAVTKEAWDAIELARAAEWPRLTKEEKLTVKAASDEALKKISTPTETPVQTEGQAT